MALGLMGRAAGRPGAVRRARPVRMRALNWRGLLLVALALAPVLALLAPAATARAAEPLEQKVKAAFVFNFARFVTWPDARFAAPDTPIELCVSGDEPFAGVLADTVRGKDVAGRPLHVRVVLAAEDLGACHVAFLGGAADPAPALAAIAGRGVLSVHEAQNTESAGVVRFYLEERRVRFEVNAAAAEREGLQLSSKLLAVAQVVNQ